MQNLLVLANKPFSSDFRKYLMRAAVSAGGRAAHIYFGDRLIFSKANGERSVFARDTHIGTIAHIVRGYLGDSSTVVLTGLGCTWSLLAFRLPSRIPNAIPVYDIYDDLLYDTTGVHRVAKWTLDRLWRRATHRQMILSTMLKSRYPHALHIRNASHAQGSQTQRASGTPLLVYVGSLDKRVDFSWLARLAQHDVRIDIWGRVHESFPDAETSLSELCRQHMNVAFHGAYDNDDLDNILHRYDVGLIPYKIGHVMTDYINPDKMYHYLNAGLEVIATPIPSVMAHAEFVHVTPHGSDLTVALDAVTANPKRQLWPVDDYRWDVRWEEIRQALFGAAGFRECPAFPDISELY